MTGQDRHIGRLWHMRERMDRLLTALANRFSWRLRVMNLCSLAAVVSLGVFTAVTLQRVVRMQKHIDALNIAYQSCQQAIDELVDSSDYLTRQTREFVTTGNAVYLDNYVYELRVADRRGDALKTLREQASSNEAVFALEDARAASDKLTNTELYAMRLAASAQEVKLPPGPAANVRLDHADEALSAREKQARANELVYGNDYTSAKFAIRDQVNRCSELLTDSLRDDLNLSSTRLEGLLRSIFFCIMLMLLVVLLLIGATSLLLLVPMAQCARSIRAEDALQPSGARELRYLIEAYNEMYELNHSRTESLSFKANNDALTGVLNRGSFDSLLTLHKTDSALILVDVDLFKHFNDDYGHDMGDAILVEVSASLYGAFRSTDYICRIGGDEFAVIAVGFTDEHQQTIARKVESVAAFLRNPENGLPPTTISVGIAFGSPAHTDESLFHEADTALYEAKRRGRDTHVFFSEL